MKIKKSNYIFSNFNKELSTKITSLELTPKIFHNIDLNNNTIKPANAFSNFFETYFNNDNYLNLKNNYPKILESIIDIHIYEFYDILLNTYKTRLFFIDNSYNLLEYTNNAFYHFEVINFKTKPIVYFKNNKIYFYTDDFKCYIEEEGNPIILNSAANIFSFLKIGEELFFSLKYDKYNIFYTIDDYLENIQSDTSLFSKLSVNTQYGEIIKIANIKNKIYIFQKYKISYINSSKENYSLMDICDLNFIVYPNTISSNESYIFFNTSNGLYIFDGNDIKPIQISLFKKIFPNNNDVSIFYNGYYYLKTTLKIKQNKNEALLKLNEEDSPVIYKINDIKELQTIKNNSNYTLMLILNNGNILNYSNNQVISGDKYIKFNKITFNTPSLKHISKIKVFNTGICSIVITSDLTKASYNIEDNFLIDNINIAGHIFQFEIESDYDFNIEAISLEINIIEDLND